MTCAMPALTDSVARAALSRWRDDPVRFAHEVLGVQTWDRQAEMLRLAARHLRVAVKSGQKTGKSTSAAILAIWFAMTRPEGRAFLTSASARQVREVLWRELTKRYRGARIPLGGTLHETPAGGLRFSGGREAIGFTTDSLESLGGFSGPNMLFILDEASGIPQYVFDAIEGNRAAGNVRVVMYSNPTQTSGEFFDAFHDKRAFYETCTISSEETPNVIERRTVIPGLAGIEHIEEKRAEWGVESPLYAVRILGEFPSQATNAVVALALVDAARRRYDATPEEGRLELGVDVARFGDDESIVAPRRGLKALPMRAFQGLDGPDLAAKVVQIARELRLPNEKPRVKIDAIGVGASPYDALKKCAELEVVAVDVGCASTGEDYARLRDQLWFAARDWLAAGGALPKDAKLEGELVAPTYTFDARNRLKVEGKDELRKRLKRSPDRADALCLAVYNPPRTHLAPAQLRPNIFGFAKPRA